MAGEWRERLSAQLDIIEETMVAQEGKDTFGFYSGGSSDNEGEREDFQYLFRRGYILVRGTDGRRSSRALRYGEVVEEDEDTRARAPATEWRRPRSATRPQPWRRSRCPT